MSLAFYFKCISYIAIETFVIVAPYITPFFFEGDANSGDSIQLNCYVSKGDTPLSVSWSFHGKELSSHLGIMTTKIGDRTSLLTISSVMASHSGEYTCSALNAAGATNHTAVLHVNGRNKNVSLILYFKFFLYILFFQECCFFSKTHLVKILKWRKNWNYSRRRIV